MDLNKTYFSRRHIDTLKINNSEAIIEGQFATLNSTLKDVQLLIKTRLTDREKFVNINLEEIGKTKMHRLIIFGRYLQRFDRIHEV